MRFASVTQIVIISVLSCAGLFALDYYKNPQLWHHEEPAAANAEQGPQLILYMNHVCLTNCADDLRQALAAVPGLDMAHAATPDQSSSKGQADKQAASLPEFGNDVEIPISSLGDLDLVAVDHALRDKGLVAGRMEIAGIPHLHFEATVENLYCKSCDRSIVERINFLKAKGAGGQFTWLDSVDVKPETNTIVAYARYVEPGKSVDAAELFSGLNEVGYAPRSVRVLTGENMKHTTSAEEAPVAQEHQH